MVRMSSISLPMEGRGPHCSERYLECATSRRAGALQVFFLRGECLSLCYEVPTTDMHTPCQECWLSVFVPGRVCSGTDVALHLVTLRRIQSRGGKSGEMARAY